MIIMQMINQYQVMINLWAYFNLQRWIHPRTNWSQLISGVISKWNCCIFDEKCPFLIWLMLSFLVMSRVHLDKLQTFLNYLLPILMKLDLSINLTFDTNHSFNTCAINHSDKIDNNWWLLLGWDLALHSLMSLWNSGFCESSNIFANFSELILYFDPMHSYSLLLKDNGSSEAPTISSNFSEHLNIKFTSYLCSKSDVILGFPVATIATENTLGCQVLTASKLQCIWNYHSSDIFDILTAQKPQYIWHFSFSFHSSEALIHFVSLMIAFESQNHASAFALFCQKPSFTFHKSPNCFVLVSRISQHQMA